MYEDSILLGWDPEQQSPGKMTLNLIIITIKLSSRFCNNKANFSCFYGTYFGKYSQAQPLSLMLNMCQAAVEVLLGQCSVPQTQITEEHKHVQ
jgi:hypothetical protein